MFVFLNDSKEHFCKQPDVSLVWHWTATHSQGYHLEKQARYLVIYLEEKITNVFKIYKNQVC